MGQSSRGGLPFNWGRIPIGFALRNPNSFISNVAFKYLARRPLGVPFEIFKGVKLMKTYLWVEPTNEEQINEEQINEEPTNEEQINEEQINEEQINEEQIKIYTDEVFVNLLIRALGARIHLFIGN